MCCNRSLNHKINRLHEKCLQIIYSDKKPSFDELLDEYGLVSIHYQNIQKLGIEMFKVNAVFSGTESIQHLDPKIWKLIPNDIKCLQNLKELKTTIKKWKPRSCPCRICKA